METSNVTQLHTFEFLANGEVFDRRIGNWYTARCYAQHVSDETGMAIGFYDVLLPQHMSTAAWWTTESPKEVYAAYNIEKEETND